MPERSRLRALAIRWAPAIAYSIGIFVVSSIPGQKLPESTALAYDKVIHALIFGGFAVVLYRALSYRIPFRFLAAVGIATAWGLLDEIHQRYTPGRWSDPFDAMADLAGAIVGAGLAMIVHLLYRAHAHRT